MVENSRCLCCHLHGSSARGVRVRGPWGPGLLTSEQTGTASDLLCSMSVSRGQCNHSPGCGKAPPQPPSLVNTPQSVRHLVSLHFLCFEVVIVCHTGGQNCNPRHLGKRSRRDPGSPWPRPERGFEHVPAGGLLSAARTMWLCSLNIHKPLYLSHSLHFLLSVVCLVFIHVYLSPV